MPTKVNTLIVAALCLCASIHAQSLPFGLFAASVNGNTQTLGSDCAPSLPCQVSIGGNTVSFTSPSPVTAPSGGNDIEVAYLDPLNPTVITVGTSNTALSCGAGATCKTGVTQFPVGSYPLYQWPIVNGQFQPYNVSYDKRALMTSPMPLTPGPGITLSQVSGQTQIGIDPVYLATLVPATGATTTTTPVVAPAVPAPSLWFQLISVNSGKCLTAQSAGTVVQMTCAIANQQQQFTFVSMHSASGALTGFQIQGKGGLVIEIKGSSTANGAAVDLASAATSSNQVFNFSPGYGGIVIKPNSSPAACLDITGVSQVDGALLQQWACTGGTNQSYELVPVD